MKKKWLAGLAVGILFLGPTPARAYNDDTHFPFTYFMARACGYTPLQAYRLACACLSIDYAAETEAEQYHRIIPSSQDAQTPRVDFHAFMDQRAFPDCLSDNRQMQLALSAILQRRQTFWEIARKSGNIGHFIHFLQDETAHFGYGSWGGHYASYGAYKNFKPLGSACDFLSYGPPERHNEMINLVIQFMTDFLNEPQFGGSDKPLQKIRAAKRGGEILPLLAVLREVNPAPAPLGPADALLVGAAWAAAGPLGSAAVAILDAWKVKRGPIMEKADPAVERALQAWGEIPVWKSGSRVFEDEPIIYDFDKGGHPRGNPDDWTLFGKLTVKLNGTVTEAATQIVVKAAKTRRGDTDEELARRIIRGSSQPEEFRMLPVGNLIVEVAAAGRTIVSKTLPLDKLENEIIIELPNPRRTTARTPKIEILSATAIPPEGKPGRFDLAVSYRLTGTGNELVQVRKTTSIAGPDPVNFLDDFTPADEGETFTAHFEHFFNVPGEYTWNYRFEIPGAPPAEGKAPVRVTEMVYVLKQGSPQLNRTRMGLKSENGSKAGIWESREDVISAASYIRRFRREQAGQVKSDLQFRYDFGLPVVIVPSKGFLVSIAGRLTGRQEGSHLGDFCRLRFGEVGSALEIQAVEGDDLFLGNRTEGPALNSKRTIRYRVLRKDAPTLTLEAVSAALRDWPLATWIYELKWIPSAELKTLLERNPGPLPGGGGGLTAVGSGEEAPGAREKELRGKLRAEPGSADLHNRLGNLLFNQKRYREAEAEYREAARLEPGAGLTRANLAGSILRQNRREEAVTEARAALDLGEAEHWIIKELGLSKSAIDLSGGGALPPSDFEKFSRGTKSAAEGVDLLKAKDWAGAEAKLREAARLTPIPTHYALLGNALFYQKKWAEAESAFRSAVDEAPDQEPKKAVWTSNIGVVLAARKKWPEAERAFRDSIRLDKLQGSAYAGLAEALLGQGRREEALAEAREALRLGFKNHPVFKILGLDR